MGRLATRLTPTLGLAASGLAFAQAPPPPIVNGETTSEWPAVGMLAALDGDTGGASVYCSATLVDDLAVVTAAHCVDAGRTYKDWGYDTVFIVGPSITDHQDYVVVEGWTAHPEYVFDSTEVGADVGVGFLAEALAIPVDPMPLHTSDLGTEWYEDDLTLVGYGITGDAQDNAGTKRTTSLPVYTLDSDFVYAVDDDPEGSNACSGDSGGAALRQDQGGWELVGVLSFVFSFHAPDTSCIGGGVGATRMDVFGDWVAEEAGLGEGTQDGGGGVVDGGGSGGGGDNPFIDGPSSGCAVLPAPVGLVGLGLGLFGLVSRRRR